MAPEQTKEPEVHSPPMAAASEPGFVWTLPQRRALAGLVAVLLIILAMRFLAHRAYVAPEPPEDGPRAGELLGRVDPNTADWPTLASLPIIGRSLAERIVEERESFRKQHPGQVPYTRPEDLKRVKGIGDATLRALEPHLIFPAPNNTP